MRRFSKKYEAITQELLKSRFHYDPETGYFTRKHEHGLVDGWRRLGGLRMSGRHRYREICIDEGRYYEHILAFVYMVGRLPEGCIDHIDGDGENNKWSNLREATHQQNLWNKKTKPTTASKVKGAYLEAGRYASRIRCNGVDYYLGRYDTAEQANAVYRQAAVALFGEYANGGKGPVALTPDEARAAIRAVTDAAKTRIKRKNEDKEATFMARGLKEYRVWAPATEEARYKLRAISDKLIEAFEAEKKSG